jgi:glucuronokinase
VRFVEYCREHGIHLPNRNFTIEYESTIPLRLGLGGSSSIITAALRALCQYYGVEIPLPIQANVVLETETRELGVPAGLQDRVIQVYEGLVYMDFSQHLMDAQGHGNYEPLDPKLLPPLYVAYRTSLSEGTEVFHNNIRERWRAGDPEVVAAMKTWANYAERGRTALLERDGVTLARVIDANFDLRAKLYHIARENLEMIETARAQGASANFAGSGGAIVGTYDDESMYQRIEDAMRRIGVGVIKPVVQAER